MKTTYEIQVFHRDQDDRLSELREAVAAELLAVGLHRTVDVIVDDAPASGKAPAVGVYLGNQETAEDPAIDAAVAAAVASGIVVIPVVENLGAFTRDVPTRLVPINGLEWSPGIGAR